MATVRAMTSHREPHENINKYYCDRGRVLPHARETCPIYTRQAASISFRTDRTSDTWVGCDEQEEPLACFIYTDRPTGETTLKATIHLVYTTRRDIQSG